MINLLYTNTLLFLI